MEQDPSKLTLSSRHNHPLLSLDYASITNSTINKQDIIIETAADQLSNDDCLCEIRLHVEEGREEEGERMEEEG